LTESNGAIMTRFEIANLIIAMLALVGAVWSTIISYRIGRRQNQLQEHLLGFEAAREQDRLAASRSASLRAWIERGRDYKLIIVNEGSSEARSIRTLIDNQPILSHSLVPRGSEEITQLGPGATISYLLAVTMGTNPVISVSLSWQDDSGEPEQWSSQLNIF
jgi:hypothetical protein